MGAHEGSGDHWGGMGERLVAVSGRNYRNAAVRLDMRDPEKSWHVRGVVTYVHR